MRTSKSGRLIVITGGPGSGKSTLIDALQSAGFVCSQEVGRRIIREQMACGGRALPWVNPLAFAEAMLSREIENFEVYAGQGGPVFFDRGVPDVIGYLRLLGLSVPAHMIRAAAAMRYERRVFIAPPWPEIFRQDEERRQDLDEAARTYRSMVATYTDFDYELIELPRVSVERRLQFVRKIIGEAVP